MRRWPQASLLTSIHQPVEELVVQTELSEHSVGSAALCGPARGPRGCSISGNQRVHIKARGESFTRRVVLPWMDAQQCRDQLKMTSLRSPTRHIEGWSLVRPSNPDRSVPTRMKERAVEADSIVLCIAQQRSRRRIGDHRLPLIGRKPGRIAGKSAMGVGGATKDGERVGRTGLAMAMVVDAEPAAAIG